MKAKETAIITIEDTYVLCMYFVSSISVLCMSFVNILINCTLFQWLNTCNVPCSTLLFRSCFMNEKGHYQIFLNSKRKKTCSDLEWKFYATTWWGYFIWCITKSIWHQIDRWKYITYTLWCVFAGESSLLHLLEFGQHTQPVWWSSIKSIISAGKQNYIFDNFSLLLWQKFRNIKVKTFESITMCGHHFHNFLWNTCLK